MNHHDSRQYVPFGYGRPRRRRRRAPFFPPFFFYPYPAPYYPPYPPFYQYPYYPPFPPFYGPYRSDENAGSQFAQGDFDGDLETLTNDE